MRVFLLGSGGHLREEERGRFEAVCSRIGKELTARGHTLIICSTNDQTADWAALKGAIASPKGRHHIRLYTGLDYSTIGQGNYDANDDTILERLKVLGSSTEAFGEAEWRAAYLAALHAADVVLGIGGSPQGTRVGLYSAEVLEKTVVVIDRFGGASEVAWDHFRRYYNESQSHRLQELGPDSEYVLQLCDIMEEMHSQRGKLVVPPSHVIAYAICGSGALALWIYIFATMPAAWPPLILVTAMAAAAAVAGVVLRSLLREFGALQSKWNGLNLILESLVGVLLVFGVVVLSQVMSLTIIAEPMPLARPEDVTRVGIILSAVSFTCTLLIEQVWSKLFGSLDRLVSSTDLLATDSEKR